MKWLTYRHPVWKTSRAGFLYQNHIFDVQYTLFHFHSELSLDQIPTGLLQYIRQKDRYTSGIHTSLEELNSWDEEEWQKQKEEQIQAPWVFSFNQEHLDAPLPVPSSVRDFYAFEEHVQTARSKRGLAMVEEWYHFPVFYFSNHQAIVGPDAKVSFPVTSKKWDFELEVGIVIGREGRNISRDEAFDYVFGLTILNDWSARDLQAEEVKVGLGPAKAKDFATSLGPFIVTPEEWMDRREGEHIQLKMEAHINGQRISKGNLNELYWTIPQLIERASRDCTLYPGDVIGTGTVGTGCLLEQDEPKWLQGNDQVQLRVERLGVLRNTIK
jgi:2-keto-4-pentenoate hydratase/2-oxohepta-3-ene-1,7-dioic acid hydratase in catechol pathway